MQIELESYRAALAAKKQKATYEDLVADLGVNQYYLWNIINDPDYEPPAWVCEKLGIAKYAPAPVCSACGDVHSIDRACELQVTVKSKPKPRVYKRWRDMPTDMLRWALENRA